MLSVSGRLLNNSWGVVARVLGGILNLNPKP